ncbi:squalene epoxidase [Pochonia chlamydosporia 170]|uniref:Squalene monooxygenase n=1 Tax=Pochonia chlamydosporia 170 TaxID=1380566 RepID=A0A179FTI9_METCM|nr:squalene epoxidase [Pochonia chlamydosporia 170]OAQ68922.2 squalene epoxidase [Pochonia chlamydosporia 170]
MSSQSTSASGDARIRREQYHEADVVVVGAGIFGCAIAYALADQGRSVLLLERWMTEPNRIVGELLQPGGIAALKQLGLGHCVDGIDAIPCKGYNVIFNHIPSLIPYPTIDDDGNVIYAWGGQGKEGKRPEGRSFHHGRFIMQLRRACLAHENITVVETEVIKTLRGEYTDQILGVETRTKDPETGAKKPDYFFGQLTIIADGYKSVFRKETIGDKKPIVKSKFYALELIDTTLPQQNYGHVVIGKNTFPTLLYQIGTHETRALFDVPTGIPAASPAAGGVRNYIKNVAIPALPPSVRPAALKALEDGKIPPSMPNSWLPPTKQIPNGLILLGDAFNMRHPLTGGGMTVAFNDALLLSRLLDPSKVPNFEDSKAIRAAVNVFYWRRKNITSIVNVLAQALYTLFAADDRQLHALQLGCFEYFQRGMTDGPCGLLGGIIQRPAVLAYHFFSVAFLSLWLNALAICAGPLGIFKAPLALIDAVLILWKASCVFLPLVWREGFQ